MTGTRAPSPLEPHQAKVGHNGVLLDTRMESESGAQQRHLSYPKEGHCKDATHANTKGGSNLNQGWPKPLT
jgi:hypothetical protein